MALKRICRRPDVKQYGQWEGDNLAELEGAFPTWTLEVNPNGTLHINNGEGTDANIDVGMWFATDAIYDDDPSTTVPYLQEVTVPDPVIYTLTTE